MHHGLLSTHGDDDWVAFGGPGPRSASQLLKDAARIAERLPEGRDDSQVLLVFRRDLYALSASLLAAMVRGHAVALPPELSRNAITELAAAKATAYVLHDTRSGIDLQVPEWLAQTGSAQPLTREALQGRSLRANVFAYQPSGQLASTPPSIPWLAQAASAAAAMRLEPGQRLFSSVGGAHPFGIVLGLLAPLLSGAAFRREALVAPFDLAEALRASAQACVLTVPAHVDALLSGPDPKLSGLRLVSGVAALTPAQCAQLEQHGITDRIDLCASGPEELSLARGSSTVSTTQDERLARALETALRALPGVRDAAVIPLTAGSEARMCAALVGEPPERAVLLRALERQLDPPSQRVELAELAKIRRDSVGNFDRNELLAHFGRKADGTRFNAALLWGDDEVLENEGRVQHRCEVQIPADYAYFEGHFPGYPILPGAAQLSEIVLPYARRVRPQLARLVEMTRLKFSGRIQPGERITVELKFAHNADSVDFALRRGASLCSAGSLAFAAVEAP